MKNHYSDCHHHSYGHSHNAWREFVYVTPLTCLEGVSK